MRGRFGSEAKDVDLDFKNIKKLAKRYGNTITTSLWRTVQERDANEAVFGIISSHPRHLDIGSGENGEKVRYFMRSRAFCEQFSNINEDQIYSILQRAATWAKRGTVVDCTSLLRNRNGEEFEFRVESFCNTYSLLTYGVMIGPRVNLKAVA